MSDPYVGEIRMVGFNFAPQGWLQCLGQLVPIAQNQALFALLGVTFGGDGVTNFGLPDFRGRGPVGLGNGPGLSPVIQGELTGTENVSLQVGQLPAHAPVVTATVAVPANAASTNVAAAPGPTTVLGPITAGGRPGSLYSTDAADTTLAPFKATVTVTPVGSNLPVPIRNPLLGTNFIIATAGIFPSRP